MSDLLLRNEGRIFLLIPGSKAGRAWIDNNVAVDGERKTEDEPIVVEPRYVGAIIKGAHAAGLEVEVLP
jgi:hypothetical protein